MQRLGRVHGDSDGGLADRVRGGTGSVAEAQQKDRVRKDPGRGVRARGSVACSVWRR